MKKKLIFSVSMVFIIFGMIIIGANLVNSVGATSENAFARKAKGKLPANPPLAGSGCSCCGNSNPATAGTSGEAVIKGDYQEATITVNGGYLPETLEVKAGLPLKLTFTQGTSSCDSVIVLSFANLKIDVTSGPQTVDLPSLKPGTYNYSCWMNMLQGRIVAK